MELREHRLPNGLQVIAECNAKAYSTSMAFFVNAGSRDESQELSGVSHFLEHMTFKGTARRSAADVNREFDELGAHSNAYTSEEHTVYYATVLPEYQQPTLDLLADIMRPSLREEDFETEKQVILEEILKYEDQPPFGAPEKCMAAFFGKHPLANSVLGTEESITAMTAEGMRGYFQQRYSPGNMTLVAAGNVDFDALIRQAEECCGDWESVDISRQMPKAFGQTPFREIHKESVAQQYAVQIASGPSAQDEDRLRYASRVMATIFGDDSGSRLFWALVDNGRCEYAGMNAYEFDGAGVFMTYLCCVPDVITENLSILRDAQQQVMRDGVTQPELELAKAKICSQLVRQSERPSNRMFAVGNAWLHRKRYQTVKQRLALYQAVDLAAINEVLEQYPLTEHATVAIGPAQNISAV